MSNQPSDRMERSDGSHEWNNIRHEVEEKKQTKTLSQKTCGEKKRDPLSIFSKVAAVLLTGTFVTSAVYMYQESEPKNEKTSC